MLSYQVIPVLFCGRGQNNLKYGKYYLMSNRDRSSDLENRASDLPKNSNRIFLEIGVSLINVCCATSLVGATGSHLRGELFVYDEIWSLNLRPRSQQIVVRWLQRHFFQACPTGAKVPQKDGRWAKRWAT